MKLLCKLSKKHKLRYVELANVDRDKLSLYCCKRCGRYFVDAKQVLTLESYKFPEVIK